MSYYAYTRVSTQKQGVTGVSLQEQRAAIANYAGRERLQITTWFEEQRTAAKTGRPVFRQMLEFLKDGRAHGVIVFKVDRGARNLRDWADLGELIDANIDVRFVNDSIDLRTRGGRLTADIQAVIAADYIRNLRDETQRGFYGRIKQGLFPLPAPVGYRDNGRGRVKTIDPVSGPLIREAFTQYSEGTVSIPELVRSLAEHGLRNRQ